jgi:hypothetical protein
MLRPHFSVHNSRRRRMPSGVVVALTLSGAAAVALWIVNLWQSF